MSSWIRRHRLTAFFVLAYAFAWAGWPFWAIGLLPEPLFLPCGPLVAALVVVGVSEGQPGFGALVARMTRWRVGWLWWIVALALLFGLYLFNPLGGAFGEEPGWRGYALPRLQADRSPSRPR